MAALSNLKYTDLYEILLKLPDIESYDLPKDDIGKTDDLFICALGFEDRCLHIPEIITAIGNYSATHSIYFEYSTNQSDNELNKPRLLEALESFSDQVWPIPCDTDEFPSQLRTLLGGVTPIKDTACITFDISVCSSRLLVTCLTILLEFDFNLRIVYSEANIYHPTEEEYNTNPEKWTQDEELGVARGVSAVTPSPDHPGSRRDNLPESVIAFPTFKPERVRAIIAHIDPPLIIRPNQRVIWLIGKPHLEEDHWRSKIQLTINRIPSSEPVYEVTTFDYKESLKLLENIYQTLESKYHINIAPLGSKMQSLGVVLFWYIRPEISIIFASPLEYNAIQYSEGCKATWRIDFGSLTDIRSFLNQVGELTVHDS